MLQHLKVENSKPPQLYLLQELRRVMEMKSSKDYHQTEKGKKEEATHTHIHTLKIHKGWLQKYLQPHTRGRETTRVLQSIRESKFHFIDYYSER